MYGVCVWVSVCVCVILLLYVIKCENNVWCVLYTLTHALTLTHSCSRTLAHLHAHTHPHMFHTLKEWICVDYNSTQFDSFWVNWSCIAPIQSNSIWTWICKFKFELSIQFQIRRHLNCVELTQNGVKLHWIAMRCVWCI